MQLIDDFFMLVYNMPYHQTSHTDLHSLLRKESLDWYAILLACNGRNFSVYKSLQMLIEKCNEYNIAIEIDSIKALQYSLLEILLQQPSTRVSEEIIQRIAALRAAGIVEYDEEQRIKSIMRQIRPQTTVQILHSQDFTQHIDTMQQLLTSATPLLKQYNHDSSIERIHTLLSQQSFTIAITGVMSAGKSTLLNALLHQEILGTSVIPETANLTIISYAKDPKAVVHFWTTQEWHNIEQSAQFDEGIQRFVHETYNAFGDNLKKELALKSKEIPTHELTTYTSAKNPQKICNLIKTVSLSLPLDFLKDGVNLIDTPGLDDPLTQREEITKNYLLNCDVIIHLMNAAQSATKKDIDFMVDALANKNIARLLVVLTHADSINPPELQAVMDYTKSSFRAKLNELGLDEMLTENLDFIPTSGYLALLHRIGRSEEALEKGYDIEKTGIPMLERALHNMLYGADSQKMRLVVYGAARHLLDCINSILSDIALQQNLMSNSLEELNKKLDDVNKAQHSNKELISTIRAVIAKSQEQFDSQCDTLQKGIIFKILEFKEILKERVLNIFEYSYKHNQKPSNENLTKTISIGLQDLIVDAKRDFVYKIERALYFFFEEIRDKLYNLNIANDVVDSSLSDYQQYLSNYLVKSPFIDQTSVLAQGIVHLNSTHNASKLESLRDELANLFNLAFDTFSARAKQWSEKSMSDLSEHLQSCLQSLFAQNDKSFIHEITALQQAINKRHDDTDTNMREKTLLLHQEELLLMQSQIHAILQKT